MQHSSEEHSGILMPVDTLAISKRLQAAGMAKKQAEAQAAVFGDIITHNLASKTDIEMMRRETSTAIEGLRNELTVKILQSKNDLLMWLIPIMIGQVAAIVGFIKLLLH